MIDLPYLPEGCERISAFDLRVGDFIVWERGRTWRRVRHVEDNGRTIVASHGGQRVRMSPLSCVVGAARRVR